MKIASADNKQVKLFAQLKHKKHRLAADAFIVEGVHLVALALSQKHATYVLFTEAYTVIDQVLFKGDQRIGEVCCPYAMVSDSVAKKLAQTVHTPGIFARCNMLKSQYNGDSVLFFDGLQDPGNVGTIIRTANAFGIRNFYFSTQATDPYNDKTIRASQGAIFFSHFFFEKRENNFLNNLTHLSALYALDLVGEPLAQIKQSKKPFGLIIGSESHGIAYKRWELLPVKPITISMDEHIESLNVAIATGIALYALTK